jgi:hypothetical protein
MELEVFFTIIQQTYSKLVISFMNRKSSCGYATHFLLSMNEVTFFTIIAPLIYHLWMSVSGVAGLKVRLICTTVYL